MEDAETKVARWTEAPPLKTSRELKLRVDEEIKRDVEILEKRSRSTREDFSQVFSRVAPRRPTRRRVFITESTAAMRNQRRQTAQPSPTHY